MHRKHGIDRGTEVTEGSGACGGYPSWSGLPPPPEKLQRTSNTIVLSLIFGIWFGVFPIGTVLPVGLFNYSQPPDVQTVHGLSE